ncbi:M56 family metallopeptidase [Chitinophaga sancti]|uniref:M56 family metallopeptidase n=1 Tax=Chitinophaga sancti TaxID=1004 RepID=A0A1K1QL41_9BACT|nr:M56 family metallopeptidase [Chitinophaga sancti]WQD65169.1 M56 family metallopeptidase [Chitinophaga sancti]WQG89207.1 M56 family metallopeptidase [Chitinophaga sancti]SFW60331.1 TonB family C-terminal domain-containing protein [Chitinophaga sancti]
MMLTYIVKVLICSGVLYGYYALALKNSTLHVWNRIFLLLAPVFSLALPLVQFPFAQQEVVMRMLEVNAYAPAPLIKTAATFDIVPLLYALYIGVVIVLLVRMVLSWRKLKLLAAQGEVQEEAGFTTIRHEGKVSPFSFFSRIFINDTLSAPILRHELAHVQGHHTIDKLVMEMLCAVCWYNPFFYLMKRELAMVHEFIADKAAASDMQADYAKVLLQTTLQAQSLAGVSTFGQSPVKRRITVLFSPKTNYSFIKKTFIIPIAIVLLLVMGGQRSSLAVSNPAVMEEVFTFVEQPPTYAGGEDELSRYLSQHIRYPREAIEKGAYGTVFVQFVVGADGVIRDVRTVGKKLGHGLEEESIRVVQAMPRWNAGSQQGKKVSVEFNLPIRFQLD